MRSDRLECAAHQQRAFQRQLRRHQRVRLRLRRRRAGLVVEDVGAARRQADRCGRRSRTASTPVSPIARGSARTSASRRAAPARWPRSQPGCCSTEAVKRGHQTASMSAGSAAAAKAALPAAISSRGRIGIGRIGTALGEAAHYVVEQRAALGGARDRAAAGRAAPAPGCGAHRPRRGRASASRSRSPRTASAARRAAAPDSAVPRISPAGRRRGRAPRR